MSDNKSEFSSDADPEDKDPSAATIKLLTAKLKEAMSANKLFQKQQEQVQAHIDKYKETIKQ